MKNALLSEHALYCVDTPRIGPSLKEIRHISGWLLCSKPVISVTASLPGLGLHEMTYGLSRPDVTGGSFDAYPNAGACGFSLAVPEGTPAIRARIEATLSVRGRFGIPGAYRMNIQLTHNGIQRAALYGKRGRRRPRPEILEEKLRRNLLGKPGITLRLDIINKCNLRCVMCHYADERVFSRPVKKITLDQFKRFFEGIGPLVRCIVLSCGDEPLMSNQFAPLVSYIAGAYPHIELEFCTNGMLMDAPIRRLIIEKGITCLTLSMDGVRKDTVERIRAGSKYERIVGNILALRDLKKASASRFPVLIMDFVMMASNIHEAPPFVELSARLGAGMIDFRHAIPSPVFNDPGCFLSHHKAKYNYFRNRVIKEAERLRIDMAIPPPLKTSEAFPAASVSDPGLGDFEKVRPDANDGQTPRPRKFPRRFSPRRTRGTAARRFSAVYCERPFSEIAIMDQEWIKPCPWHQSHLGRLSEGQTLHQVFFGQAFTRLRKNMLALERDPNCEDCPWKGDLLVGRITHHGGVFRKYLHRCYALLKKMAPG